MYVLTQIMLNTCTVKTLQFILVILHWYNVRNNYGDDDDNDGYKYTKRHTLSIYGHILNCYFAIVSIPILFITYPFLLKQLQFISDAGRVFKRGNGVIASSAGKRNFGI